MSTAKVPSFLNTLLEGSGRMYSSTPGAGGAVLGYTAVAPGRSASRGCCAVCSGVPCCGSY